MDRLTLETYDDEKDDGKHEKHLIIIKAIHHHLVTRIRKN